ncbi:MAG: VOC family protein [Acidimicrobiales bacterium]|nr:VOC family protein [Acidimicrobiales bacterium]
MIDHIGIEVADITASTEFYTRALAPLGITPLMEFEGGVGFGSDLGSGPRPYLWLNERGREPVSGAHIALRAKTIEQVQEFYEAAIAAGGTDNGAPGPRPHYHPGYYGAFVFDPDGNNIEAVCHAYTP